MDKFQDQLDWLVCLWKIQGKVPLWEIFSWWKTLGDNLSNLERMSCGRFGLSIIISLNNMTWQQYFLLCRRRGRKPTIFNTWMSPPTSCLGGGEGGLWFIRKEDEGREIIKDCKKHQLQMVSSLLHPLLVTMRNGRWLGLNVEGRWHLHRHLRFPADCKLIII